MLFHGLDLGLLPRELAGDFIAFPFDILGA